MEGGGVAAWAAASLPLLPPAAAACTTEPEGGLPQDTAAASSPKPPLQQSQGAGTYKQPSAAAKQLVRRLMSQGCAPQAKSSDSHASARPQAQRQPQPAPQHAQASAPCDGSVAAARQPRSSDCDTEQPVAPQQERLPGMAAATQQLDQQTAAGLDARKGEAEELQQEAPASSNVGGWDGERCRGQQPEPRPERELGAEWELKREQQVGSEQRQQAAKGHHRGQRQPDEQQALHGGQQAPAAGTDGQPPALGQEPAPSGLLGVDGCAGGLWRATFWQVLDSQGRCAASGRLRHVRCEVRGLASWREAAAARDMLSLWRRRPGQALLPRHFNFQLDSLAAAAPGLEARLHACATWLQLHGMVQGMAASGELARAAAAAALRSTAQQAVQRTAASGGGGGGGRAARQAGRPGAAGSPAAAAVARSRSAVGASPGGSGAAKPPPAKRQVRSSPAAAAAAAASVQQAAGGQAARGAQAAGLHAAGTVGTSSLPSGVWRAHTTLSLDGGQRPSAAGPRRVCYLGAYAGRREAALARDLALTWQERRAGLPPPTPLNFPLRTLPANDAALTALHRCVTLPELRARLQQLSADGALGRLDARLGGGSPPPAAAPAAAPRQRQPPASPAGRRVQGLVNRSDRPGWDANLQMALDDQGRPSAGSAAGWRWVGTFQSIPEAELAHDLALLWFRRGVGLPPEADAVAFPLPSLRRQKSLLRRLWSCGTVAELRALLRELRGAGRLAELAARLTPPPADAPPQARKRRRAAADPGGWDAQAGTAAAGQERQQEAAVQLVKGEPSEVAAEQTAPAAHSGGRAAVGRRLRAWLVVDGGEEEEHEGLVAELTPSGKHHVLFDDGEEALLDLGATRCTLLGPAAAAAADGAAPAPAAAAAAPHSDVGQRLHVWWPQDGLWYAAAVTHVLRNGMYCVRYEADGLELLLAPLEQRVQWAGLDRQRSHERALRQAQQARQREQGWERAAAAAAAAEGGVCSVGTSGEGASSQQRQQGEEQLEVGNEERQPRASAAHAGNNRRRSAGQPADAAPPRLGPKHPRLQPRQPGGPGRAAAPATAMGSAAVVAADADEPGAGAAQAHGGGAPPPGGDLFEDLLTAAGGHEAAAAGLTPELVGSLMALMGALGPQQQATKERHLRLLLGLRQFAAAAEMIRVSMSLALGGT